jgi:hypothetical protein
MFISLILLFVANYRERHREKFGKIADVCLFGLFVAAYLAVCVLTFKSVSSVLITTTSVITLICIWWLPPQKMRLAGCFNSILYLAYQISIQNWAGFLEVFVIVSNTLSYVKYRKENSH